MGVPNIWYFLTGISWRSSIEACKSSHSQPECNDSPIVSGSQVLRNQSGEACLFIIIAIPHLGESRKSLLSCCWIETQTHQPRHQQRALACCGYCLLPRPGNVCNLCLPETKRGCTPCKVCMMRSDLRTSTFRKPNSSVELQLWRERSPSRNTHKFHCHLSSSVEIRNPCLRHCVTALLPLPLRRRIPKAAVSGLRGNLVRWSPRKYLKTLDDTKGSPATYSIP